MSHCPSDGLKFNKLRFYVLGNEFSALILSVLTKMYKRLNIFNSLELVFWTQSNHFMGVKKEDTTEHANFFID